MLRKISLVLAIAAASSSAQAAFTTFEGGLAEQSDWQAAAGSFVLEGFESYAPNTPIPALPALHLSFDNTIGGTPPGIYEHNSFNTPSGPRELANFPGNCCITAAYANGDVVAHVDAGVNLTAFGFWNGDPQGDAVLSVYDRMNNLLGTVTALVNNGGGNSFAGFVSSAAVGRLEWEGSTGDGFNHYDDFQASFALAVPEPEVYAMLIAGLALFGFARRGQILASCIAMPQFKT